VLVPGASTQFKRWEAEKFMNILNMISDFSDMVCVICGNNNETSMAESISSKTKSKTIIVTGQTDLLKLSNIVNYSKFVIANDTAAIHIATALNVPSVCILGGGHFGRFAPYPESLGKDRNLPICVYNQMPCYNCNWKCIYTEDKTKPYPCIRSITVEQVWKKVKPLIDTNKH